MRLLQLSTGAGRLIDLHPNVTVVSGLDDTGRQILVDTVVGLARGVAPERAGLLEAHGLLFDLNDEMLGLLDVSADELQPVVTTDDLPTVRQDPRARERVTAERAVAEAEERWATAGEDQKRLQAAHDVAGEALEHARRTANEAEAGAAERIRLIDELTVQLDQIEERRRQLQEQQTTRAPEAEAAQARRLEIEAATVDVRTRHQEAAIACSMLAGRLDDARLSLDPDAVVEADATNAALAHVEAEVQAERAVGAALHDEEPGDAEPPAERLARVQTQIDELETRLAAYGPTDALHVASALNDLRACLDGELVPHPPALELADQLATLEADLAATPGVGTSSGGLAISRTRLDEARHALLEAEQAVRNPELDRELVERLELAHAGVLAAADKADGRFAGGRAQKRVDAARDAEQALLDELGFASYSDYMMGYSLLNVDSDKEAALDAARIELSAAEDEWRLLEAETEAELARAERMERRRQLVDEARGLLGRPVGAGAAVDELRAMRVPAMLPPELVVALESSLDEAGVAVADEELSRDDLIALAEAWLTEVDESSAREGDLRQGLTARTEERLAAIAAVEAEHTRSAALDGPPPEEERQVRLRAARAAVEAATIRQQAHAEAEAVVAAISSELAAAVEAERLAADEAAGSEAAVTEAAERADRLVAEVAAAAEELDRLRTVEVDANEHLQSLSDHEYAPREQLERELGEAEAAFAEAEARLGAASVALQALVVERAEAQTLLDSFDQDAEPLDEGSIAEEVEWYLLARLAAQRAVCLGGSLPLLLDGALEGLDEDQLGHVLGRLERMADAVQVIVVSDDPLAATWALMAGQDRAAVVAPQPA